MILNITIISIYSIACLLTLNELAFWLYVIQLKEYRLDRLRDFFNSSQGREVLKKRFYIFIFACAIIFSYVINNFFIESNIPSWQRIIPLIGLALFVTIQLFSFIQKLRKKALKFPKITFRLSVIVTNSIVLFGLLTFLASPLIIEFSEAIVAIFYFLTPFIALLATALSWPVASIVKRKIIANATKKREAMKNLTVIGITGSYGKTSVKEYVYEVLKRKYNTLKTEEHINSEIGVAQTIINYLTKKHEVFVVEMGAYKRGEIKILADMAKPHIGIITGINEQHLSLFGGIKNTVKAKSELVYALPKNGYAILNGDNYYTQKVASKLKIKKALYSVRNERDIYLINQKIVKGKTQFTVKYKNKELDFVTNLIGIHNIQNLLAAILVGFKLGLSHNEIKIAISKIKPLEKNLNIISKKKTNIIDNTYNLNPDSFTAAIELINLLPKGKNIIIMDDILELGDKGVEIHRNIAKKIAKHFDMIVYIGTLYKKEVIATIKADNTNVKVLSSQGKNLEKIFGNLDKSKNIFMMGRRGEKYLKYYLD